MKRRTLVGMAEVTSGVARLAAMEGSFGPASPVNPPKG